MKCQQDLYIGIVGALLLSDKLASVAMHSGCWRHWLLCERSHLPPNVVRYVACTLAELKTRHY